MIGQIFPLFESGRILRREMLEAFTDYSYRFGELLHTNYADGIISGCQLTTTQDAIILNPGLLCFDGRVFLVKEPTAVGYHPTNTINALKVRCLGEVRTESSITYEMELIISEDITSRSGQIELCRFTLQPGARLRCEYVDFEDRSTEYDTINNLHSPYAAPGQSTLNPAIIKAFANEMLTYSLENTIDISFCLNVLGQPGPVCTDAIGAYVKLRADYNETAHSNKRLYDGLLSILQEIQKGNHEARRAAPQQRRTILID